jgi:hypothetical protein
VLLEHNDAALEDGVVPTQAPAMLVLRPPPELSARKGRKSPCVLGRDNQQKNKWACVCHPDPENRPRGRAFHDPGCIRGLWATDGTLSFEPQEGRVVKILHCALPRDGYVVWHTRAWRVSDSDVALLTQLQNTRVTIKEKRKRDEAGPACLCGNQPTRKRKITKVDSANKGRFFWGCQDWTSEGNGCSFFQIII